MEFTLAFGPKLEFSFSFKFLSSIPELQIAQKNNQNLCPDYLE